MPVNASHFDSIRKTCWICFPHLSAWAPEIRIHNESADHVESVQTGQSKINGEVGACSWKMVVFELGMIFKRFNTEKNESAENSNTHIKPVFFEILHHQ